MGNTSAQDTGNLQEWGQLLAGKWSIQSATPNEDGTIAVANGSHTIGWLEGRGAIEAVCVPPAVAPAARAGMRWMAMWDATSGQIKQTSIRADGLTEVAYISKQSNGEWAWRQTRPFPNGAVETNTATFTASNGGKTLTQHVTNRVLTGAAQPLVGYTPSASGEASPHLSDVCNVSTQTKLTIHADGHEETNVVPFISSGATAGLAVDNFNSACRLFPLDKLLEV